MNVGAACGGLFVDTNDTLYCSMFYLHRVVKGWLNDRDLAAMTVVAGTGSLGSAFNELSGPWGIFVDVNFDLYVADFWNNRVQLFRAGQLSGVTVAGSQSPSPTITLSSPMSSSLQPQNAYVLVLSTNNQTYSRDCNSHYRHYESIQLKVKTTGLYSFLSHSDMDIYGLIYGNTFNPLSPVDNLLHTDDDGGIDLQMKLNIQLSGGRTYGLVVTTSRHKETGTFSIAVSGDDKVILERVAIPVSVPSVYSSQLTVDSPTYYRDFQIPKCYVQTLEINVVIGGLYVIWSESNIPQTYGYLYKNDFNALKSFENLLLQHDGSCNEGQFKLYIDLEMNTRYVLVVTTHRPKIVGNFSVFISGPDNVTLHQTNVGYIKSIGWTLDDILRDELQPNQTFNEQSSSIKISAALTIILFVGGLVNSTLSLITFQNKECRQVGCGIYLLASSVTSFLTISMFTVKFWFVVFTQINVSASLSVLRSGCASIEVMLKLFLYLDGWLNACVAVERAAQVLKGVSFDKKKSRYYAYGIIFILPICITCTLMHELLHRRLLVYATQMDRYVSCVTRYPAGVQDYSTTILFFHLVAPFVANLVSALLIIFGAARRRSSARKGQNFGEHVREQFKEHKHLLISPVILLVLSVPRLIISLLPDGVKVSDQLWLYLLGYLISFISSVLVFLIFVVPSELYMKTFKNSFSSFRCGTGTRR